MSYDLSIVIPSLSHSKNLILCCEWVSSALRETAITAEVLVVDNSESKSDYSFQSHSHCHFKILKSDRGVNRARNKGLFEACSNIVLFLDDDCFMKDSSLLKKHIEFHRAHPDCFAIGGNYQIPANASYIDRFYIQGQQNWLLRGLHPEGSRINFLLGGNLSMKKNLSTLSNVSFDENITYGGSETELFVHALTKNLKCHLIDAPIEHNCRMNLLSLAKKSYRQGRGKKYRDLKWTSEISNRIYCTKAKDQNSILQKIQKFFFDLGYKKSTLFNGK